jgi:hypothetical protein
MICVEIKTGTGRLSKDQKLFRDMILDNCGVHATIRSTDDVLEFCRLVRDSMSTSGSIGMLKFGE